MSPRARRLLLALVAAGVLVRAAYLVAPVMDSDQAVFGLQARHVLLGEFPVFSWGYAYIGTPQSYLAAAVFALVGSSRLVLDAVPLLLAIPFVLACHALGRTWKGPALGLAAAALVAIAPPYLALHGAWARHGYMDTLLLGSVILLLAARLGRDLGGGPREARRFAALGLVGGVAWWVNVSSLFYLVPAALFLLLVDWRVVARRGPWLALGFFLLGSAPFWLWNAGHAFTTLRLFKGREGGAAAPGQLARILAEGVPTILGARGSHARTNFLPGASEALLALYAVALAWLLWRALAALRAGRRPEPPVALLLLCVATAGGLLGVSRYGEAITAEGTKRYLLPLYPTVLLLGALFLDRVRERSRPLFAGLLALPLGLALYGNVVSNPWVRGELPAYRAERAQDAALFAWLRARGLTRVYATDYWLAPRLTFDAGEAIVFAQPAGDRHPPYPRLVDAAPRVAYVFAGGEAEPFAASLRGIGATFERTQVGPYVVFHDFRAAAPPEAVVALPPDGWRATASAIATPPGRAFDRDVDTSWYSGEPQRPGQFFQLDLGRPTRVAKVGLLPPRPSIGAPRGYRIEVSADGERWEETAAIAAARWSLDWGAGQPRMGPRHHVVTVFAPREVRYVRVTQTGADPRWWWAIGEIFVYGPPAGDRREPGPARALLERGREDERAGRLGAAARAYWEATRLEPGLEAAHARLAAAYEEARVPLEGAAPPPVRAQAFEALGLWLKAARESLEAGR